MNRFFFRELLAGDSGLLEGAFAFNPKNRPVEPMPEGALWEAAAGCPDLVRIWAQRHPRDFAADAVPYWDFTQESQRLAFMTPAALSRLTRLACAAVFAPEIAATVVRSDVEPLRAFLGRDVYHWALTRGRWQIGSLRTPLAAAASGISLEQKCASLARLMLEALRAGWPEALKERTRHLFEAIDLPDAYDAPALDSGLRDALWYFLKKLIVRELDKQWQPYFD
ncbi:MAG: hypothetical protein ACI4SV_00285 [Duodenibacillus sp.]